MSIQIDSIPSILRSCKKETGWLIGLIVFNATFNNISAISWQSVLMVEETGRPGENQRPVASH
jgi:hypothetical protein